MGHLFKGILLLGKVALKPPLPAATFFAIPSAEPAASVVPLSDSANQEQVQAEREFLQKDDFLAALVPWPCASQFLSLCWQSARGREGVGTTFEQQWNVEQTMILVNIELEPLTVKTMTLMNRKTHYSSAWSLSHRAKFCRFSFY